MVSRSQQLDLVGTLALYVTQSKEGLATLKATLCMGRASDLLIGPQQTYQQGVANAIWFTHHDRLC